MAETEKPVVEEQEPAAPVEAPVVYYSDVPGAGPDDVPAEAEKGKKQVAAPPQNKAVSQKAEQTK